MLCRKVDRPQSGHACRYTGASLPGDGSFIETLSGGKTEYIAIGAVVAMMKELGIETPDKAERTIKKQAAKIAELNETLGRFHRRHELELHSKEELVEMLVGEAE